MKIEEVYSIGEGELLAVFTRGAVDKSEFIKAADSFLGGVIADTMKEIPETLIQNDVGYVYVEWWRNVPLKNGETRIYEAIPHSKGAYIVTAFNFQKWER